jgi:hypothetical protein
LNDGISLGLGYTVPSEKNFWKEFFIDAFYRLQLFASAQLTLDIQLYVNPSNPEQPQGFASIYSLRYFFSF